jgi:hypothetical protein
MPRRVPWRRLTSHTIQGVLARFPTDVTWTGTIQPGGMGGRRIVGTYQQDQSSPTGPSC